MGFCPGDCCGSWIYTVRYLKISLTCLCLDASFVWFCFTSFGNACLLRQSSSYVKRITRQKQLQHVFIQHRNEGHDDDKMKLAWLVTSSSFPRVICYWSLNLSYTTIPHFHTYCVMHTKSDRCQHWHNDSESLYIYIYYISHSCITTWGAAHTRAHTHTHTDSHTHSLSLSLILTHHP